MWRNGRGLADFALQLVAFALQLVAFARQLVAFALQLVAFALQLVAFALRLQAFARQLPGLAWKLLAVGRQPVRAGDECQAAYDTWCATFAKQSLCRCREGNTSPAGKRANAMPQYQVGLAL